MKQRLLVVPPPSFQGTGSWGRDEQLIPAKEMGVDRVCYYFWAEQGRVGPSPPFSFLPLP